MSARFPKHPARQPAHMFKLTKRRFVTLLLGAVIFIFYAHRTNLLQYRFQKDDEDYTPATDLEDGEMPVTPEAETHHHTKTDSIAAPPKAAPPKAGPPTKPPASATTTADKVKQAEIVEAFKWAWSAYERDAMGSDEYHPISKQGSNLTWQGGVGFMVVDAIDTMLIMGLKDEYKTAHAWIKNDLSFDRDGTFNTFETTIRVLGGLLSAYHLSENDPVFLKKAVDLGDRLLAAFDTPSGLPTSDVNLKTRIALKHVAPVSTAEASTLQLEFRYLSYLTDNEDYWKKAEKAMAVIKEATITDSEVLVPIHMDADTGKFQPSDIRLGSRGDSYYEYLLKQYLQTGMVEKVYLGMYEETMKSIHDRLVRPGLVTGLKYTIELAPEYRPQGKRTYRESPKQDHLVCFLGGSLMLGATTTANTGTVSVPPEDGELTATGNRDWNLGMDLVDTCVDTYESSATGLSPEIAYFWDEVADADGKDRDWYIKGNGNGHAASYDARYILRPETVESLFIAYRLTGDEKYRKSGWKIFQAIQKYCRIESGGYASILNVDDVKTEHIDKMDTFFLGETLKYLYLLFADTHDLPLSRYVFNTEAHPLPIFKPKIKTGFS